MAETSIINDLIAQAANRRSFIRKIGMASAALGAVAVTTSGVAQAATITDGDILNFALNLEYLEADFYTIATTGNNISTYGINTFGPGTVGATTGGQLVTFTDPLIQAIALELAADERSHVTLLQNAITGLGYTFVGKPPINLNAMTYGFSNMNDFLWLARIFEDIGVTAYAGAATQIQSNAVLGYAARILATEAMHAGNIRAQMARIGIAAHPLDGADHTPPPFGSEYFNTDSNGLVETRTPAQVLYLAYGSTPNFTSGGFFPAGVNGNINTSSAGPAVSDAATLSASPNPIPVVGNAGGITTISWNAPSAQIIQIHVGSPSGALFTTNVNIGSMSTNTAWVTEGMILYLQDVSGGKALTPQNTLATLVLHLQKM